MELKSERLIIKPPTKEEAYYHKITLNDWEVIRWLSGPPYPYEITHWHNSIDHWKDEEFRFSIWFENKPIGIIDITGNIFPEFGYFLNKDYWGKGIMKEAADMLFSYWDQETGKKPVWSGLFSKNYRSMSVLNHCKFRVVGYSPNIFISKEKGYTDMVRLVRE